MPRLRGFAYGKHYSDGGQLRVFNDHGGLVCAAQTSEQIDSSPAIGPILPGGAYGIATGTGSYWGITKGTQPDDDTVKVFNTNCNQVWSDTLNGYTGGSPALADVEGNGQLAVVEGTQAGTVYAVERGQRSVLWQTNVLGSVYGSVTTANLGVGYQDVIVPTISGIEILDGTGGEVADFDDGSGGTGTYGFQNAPLMRLTPMAPSASPWPISAISTLAALTSKGSSSTSRSRVRAVPGERSGQLPQFHHDAQLTGFVGGGGTPGTCNPTGGRH